jgi:hypothetical protein
MDRTGFVRLQRFWGRLGRVRAAGWQPGPARCALGGVAGYPLVVNQVGPVPFRCGVLGIGYQECARLGKLVSLPSGIK